MKRKKWQGLTCVLLAGLMMAPAFASSSRNAVPNQTPSTQKESTNKIESTNKTASTNKVESTKPAPSQAPKPVTGQTTHSGQTGQQSPQSVMTPQSKTCPASPSTQKSAAPAQQTPGCKPSGTTSASLKIQVKKVPKQEAAPKCGQDVKDNQAPKDNQTKTNCKGTKNTKEEGNTKQQQKPFALDHFKMIVGTLKQLGMEENEIAGYIKDGKKLEDILAAEKISPKKFKKCILKQYCKVIDEGVKAEQITKEQGKQLKIAVKETVKSWFPQK